MLNSYSCINQYFFSIFLSALTYGNMIVLTCIEDIACLYNTSPSFDLFLYCMIFSSLNLVGYVLCTCFLLNFAVWGRNQQLYRVILKCSSLLHKYPFYIPLGLPFMGSQSLFISINEGHALTVFQLSLVYTQDSCK